MSRFDIEAVRRSIDIGSQVTVKAASSPIEAWPYVDLDRIERESRTESGRVARPGPKSGERLLRYIFRVRVVALYELAANLTARIRRGVHIDVDQAIPRREE